MKRHILAIDQSTQGTKALLVDEDGCPLCRTELPHKQHIDARGWIEHDPVEIYQNTLAVCAAVLKKAGVAADTIAAIGLTNQRETSLLWDKKTGQPLCNAVVWQCARAAELCKRSDLQQASERIRSTTGLRLSPYFPAAKLCWMLNNVPAAKELAKSKRLACGTIDSWLIFKLTGEHRTDLSNASRTQLFDIVRLRYDETLCGLFSVPLDSLPEVCMSDACFGVTELNGLLPHPVPILGVLGDSHAALFAQNCRSAGRAKVTYGTGSSLLLQLGDKARFCDTGLTTSLAWGMHGRVDYVLEGNLNYTGAVIAWMKNDLGLIRTEAEASELALLADPFDSCCLVPAFSGLGTPYGDTPASALITGMTRTTGRKELVKAGLDCIACQVADLTELFARSGAPLVELRADGGATASPYLMQLQSDLCALPIRVSAFRELSALGAGLMAGLSLGLYDESVFDRLRFTTVTPRMSEALRQEKLRGWRAAVRLAASR